MKKRLIGLLAAITLLSQVGFVMPLTAGAAGNAYYVSVTGSDQNPGTTVDAPFKTISKATKVMKAGDTCYIMGGTYREAVDMNIYGTATNPVTYQAYNNEKVIVTTADLLTGWEKDSVVGNAQIWKAPMNWTVKSGRGNMLFNGNELQREATYPNISDFLNPSQYAYIQEDALGIDYRTVTLTHADIPDIDLTGAVISYDTRGGYWNYTSKITSYDGSSTIVFNAADHSQALIPAKGKKFFITRAKGLIDVAGEWYKDEANSYIYYATSTDADLASNPTVAAKKRENTLIMDNAQYVVVKNITLQGGPALTGDLTKHCTWDGITVDAADYEIYHDRTMMPSATGFTINGSDNTIQNSEIKNNHGYGIRVDGHDNRVINNEIHDINYQHYFSDAISVNGERNLVSYNTMYRLGRSAIGGSPVNCEISYNDMSDAMRISADGGFIYLLGDRGNTRIHHNVIHDVANDASDGFKVGIYYDASSTKLITYNNVIYNINGNDSSELFLNTPSVNNVFFNNTIMNDSPVIKVNNTDTGTSRSTMQGVVFINNLFKTDPLTDAIREEQAPVYMNNVINGGIDSQYKPVSGSSVIDAGADISGITDNVTDGKPDVGAYEYGEDWVAGKQDDTTPEVYFEEDTKIPFKNIAVNYGFENDFEGYTIETGTPTIMDFSSWSFNNLFTFTGDKALALDTNDSVSYKATGLKPNTEYEIEFFSKIRGMLLKPSEVDVKIEGNSFITGTSSIGGIITGIKSGDYIGYKNVDFGNGRFDSATFHLMGPENGTEIEVRLDDPKTGEVIATYTRTEDLNPFFDTYWMPYDATENGMSSIEVPRDVYVVFKTVKSQEFTYGGLELHNSNTSADKIEATAISDNGASYKHEAVYKEALNYYSSSIMEPTWGQKPEKFTATTGSLGELDIYLKKSAGENIGYIDLLAIRDASLDSVEDILVGNAKIVDGNFNEVLSLGNSTVNIVDFEAQNNLKDAIECSFTAIGYKADGTEASKSIIDVTMKPFEKRTIGVGVNLQNIPGGYIELTTQKEGGDPITSVLANIFAVNQREATEGIVIDKVWLSDTLQKVTAGEENKTFNAMIKNTTNADKTIACIVAFYGDNNRLLFAGREEKVLKASEINTFTKIINVPAGCTYAKMFAWDITEGANGATQIAADIALGL